MTSFVRRFPALALLAAVSIGATPTTKPAHPKAAKPAVVAPKSLQDRITELG